MQFQSIENRCSRIIFLADEKLQVSVLLGDIGVNLDNLGDGIRRHINCGRNSRTDYIRARAAARMAAYLESPAVFAFKNTALIIG